MTQLSQHDIRSLEVGHKPLTHALARRISAALNVSVTWLLAGSQAAEAAPDARNGHVDLAAWTDRVVRAILTEGSYLTPQRPAAVSARLIAHFAARPNRLFEIEVYEERVRALQARAALQAAPADGRHG